MLNCEYCGGSLQNNQTDCPHCGSSLLIEDSTIQSSQPTSSADSFIIPFSFHKWLVFRQNIIVILLLGFFLSILYLIVPAIPIIILLKEHPLRGQMLIYACFPIAYYLMVLTILQFYKGTALKKQYVINDGVMRYFKNGMRRAIALNKVQKIETKQSPAQAKYSVGTLAVTYKLKVHESDETHTLHMHNIDHPDSICTRIMDMVKKTKPLQA